MDASISNCKIHFGLGHKAKESCKRALSLDGKYILTGSYDCTIRLWNVLLKKEIKVFSGHSEKINCLEFCNNVPFAISGSDDFTFRLWDLRLGESWIISENEAEAPEAVAISHDDDFCVLARMTLCEIFSLNDRRITNEIFSNVYPNAVAIAPDKNFAAIGGSTGVEVVDLNTWEMNMLTKGFCSDVIFSKDGNEVLIIGTESSIIHKIVDFYKNGHDNYQNESIACTKNYFITEENANLAELGWGHILRSDLTTVFTRNLIHISPRFAITREISTYTDSYVVLLKNLQSNTSVELEGISDQFQNLIAINTSGSFGLLIDNTPDPGNGQQTSSLGITYFDDPENIKWLDHDYAEDCVGAISFDDSLAVTSKNEQIHVWDLENLILLKTISGHTSFITSIAIGPDNKTIITGSEKNSLVCWDLNAGKVTRVLEGHNAKINAVTISTNCLALSVSEDHKMILWDLNSGKLQKEYMLKDTINRIAFSLDNGYCLFGCTGLRSTWSNAISFLDLKTGKVKAILPLFKDWHDHLVYNENSYFAGKEYTISRMVSYLNGLEFADLITKQELINKFYDKEAFDFMIQLGYGLYVDENYNFKELPL